MLYFFFSPSPLSWPTPCAGPASILVIQYFRSCAMSSVSWYFFMSPCMLSLNLFFGRPLLLLPETSSLSDFTQMWLRSRLKQWPNHFCFLGKFQQVLRPPPSWCLHFWCDPTWSSLLPIMLHFYRAIFLTSQVIQRHTLTSIRIKKYVKSITKNKSIGSVIQIKINQCSS